MIKIRFYGNVSGCPSAKSNTTSLSINYNGQEYLFDCSEGTTRTMRQMKVSMFKISHIFISHFHGDHFFGLTGLLSTIGFLGRERPMHIYCPMEDLEELKNYLNSAFKYLDPGYDIVVHGIERHDQILFENNDIEIRSYKVQHVVPSYGFVFKEKPKLNIDKDKLKELGIGSTPVLKELKKGKPIEINGKIVRPEDLLTKKREEISIFYSGDTIPLDYGQGFDVVIHEATFAKDNKDLAIEYGHSFAELVAKIAKKNRVKLLILTHFSQRYEKNKFKEIINEAQEIFENVVPGIEGTEIHIEKRNNEINYRVENKFSQTSLF